MIGALTGVDEELFEVLFQKSSPIIMAAIAQQNFLGIEVLVCVCAAACVLVIVSMEMFVRLYALKTWFFFYA